MAELPPNEIIKRLLAGECRPEGTLLALVDRASGKMFVQEDQYVDFKQRVHLTEDRQVGEIAKDILGFSNAEGGIILAGVSDDGSVVGHDILSPTQIRQSVGIWAGTRLNYEISNQAVTIRGQTTNLGIIVVHKNSVHTPGLLRKDVELRPGLLRKIRYLKGSLPYRQGSETIVEPPGPSAVERARELGFTYVAYRTRSSFLLAEDRPGMRLYAHINDRFFGREREIAELMGKFDDARGRGVSIAGFGGIGKTELAIQLVHLLYQQKRFSRIYSGSAKSTLLAISGIAEADPIFSDFPSFIHDLAAWAGLETANGGSEQELAKRCVSEFEKQKRVLLFLDNLETVTDPRVVDFLDTALPANVWVIATSRWHKLRNYVFAKDLDFLQPDAGGRLLRHELKRQGLQDLADLDIKRLRHVATALRLHPLAIRWFAWLCSRDGFAWERGPGQMPSDELEAFCVAHTLDHLSEPARKALAGTAIIQSGGTVNLECLTRVVEVKPRELEAALHELECSGLINVAVDQESGSVTYSVSEMAVGPVRDLARNRGWETPFVTNHKSFLRHRGGVTPTDPLVRTLLEVRPQSIRMLLEEEKRSLLEQVNRVKHRFPAYRVELLHLEGELHRQLGNLATADEKYREAGDSIIQTPGPVTKERHQVILLEAATVAKQAGGTVPRLARAVGYLERIRTYQTGALRVFGMLAEFNGELGDRAKFDEYAERLRMLVQERGLPPRHPQRIQAEAALDRGKDSLRMRIG